jgi:hypothetical protein
VSALDRVKDRLVPQALANGNGHSPGAPRPAISESELSRRHSAAARRFAEEQWNLGGLAYEMAIRDHFRLDVLQRAAAKVQEADAELSNLSRLLELEQAGAAGACVECGTLYGRGSAFCSSCGVPLVESVQAR